MRIVTGAAVLTSLSLIACGSTTDSTAPVAEPASSQPAFKPAAAPEGYTRFTAKTIPEIQPGADVTYCQYVMPPLDRDMDVLNVGGYQSKFGHHAVAFSYTDNGTQVIGESTQCMGTEVGEIPMPGSSALSEIGTFLGGIGGDISESGQTLPEGVAFRMKAGQGIMLNVHYINTGPTAMSGDAVVDVQFAEVDPNRKIAALFVNVNADFDLPAGGQFDSSAGCVAGSDVKILMLSNHMHEYGTSAKTEVVRAGTGVVEVLHHDPEWTYEMQFNGVYSRWPVDSPFVLHTGDTITTSCSWRNPTAESIVFPREMCIGVGFALASGDDPTAPACFQGQWFTGFGR